MADDYSSAVVCSKGCTRGNNEDNFYFLGDRMLLKEMDEGAHIVYTGSDDKQSYAIFDGMGGGDSGEVAASIAAELFAKMEDRFYQEHAERELLEYARRASDQIYDYAQKHLTTGQGSTFAGLILYKGRAFVVNVGDSRVYLHRNKKLEVVTKDHSYVYELFQEGKLTEEQARKHPKNNVITHYLGMQKNKLRDEFAYADSFRICRGDRFMLCSDGLCDLLSREEIQQVLNDEKKPDEAAVSLVRKALELGGKDNATCIVVDVRGE